MERENNNDSFQTLDATGARWIIDNRLFQHHGEGLYLQFLDLHLDDRFRRGPALSHRPGGHKDIINKDAPTQNKEREALAENFQEKVHMDFKDLNTIRCSWRRRGGRGLGRGLRLGLRLKLGL